MLNKKGLTLIELLIVIIVLGALVAIAIPRITNASFNAKKNVCNTNVNTLNTSMEVYNNNKGAYPTTLTLLTGDTNYFPDGAPTCPFGSSYSFSGTVSNRVAFHSH